MTSPPKTYFTTTPAPLVGAKARLREEIRNPYVPAHNMRLKWDNIAIVAVAIIISIVALPQVLKLSDSSKPDASLFTAPPHVKSQPTDHAMTMTEASEAVELARADLAAGNFEGALSKLDPIPSSLFDDSGASDLSADITDKQGHWIGYNTLLNQAIQTHRWQAAADALKQLALIAPLTQQLKNTQQVVAAKLSQMDNLLIAKQQLKDGNYATALATAQRGYSATQDPKFAELITLIKNHIATHTSTASGGGGGSGGTPTTSSATSTPAPNSSQPAKPSASALAQAQAQLNLGNGQSSNGSSATEQQLMQQLQSLLSGLNSSGAGTGSSSDSDMNLM